MKDYIERASVHSIIERTSTFAFTRGGMHEQVDSLPAANVVEVRYGRWEPGNPICPICGENKFKDLDADVWADWQPKFCPNCGALMREVGNGEK